MPINVPVITTPTEKRARRPRVGDMEEFQYGLAGVFFSNLGSQKAMEVMILSKTQKFQSVRRFPMRQPIKGQAVPLPSPLRNRRRTNLLLLP